MYFCISSTSFYLIFLIFRKYVLSTWFNKMLGPEILLTCSGLNNSCCKWFCSRFGRVVTENVTTRDVGCRWTSPTLDEDRSPPSDHLYSISELHLLRVLEDMQSMIFCLFCELLSPRTNKIIPSRVCRVSFTSFLLAAFTV